MSEKKGARGVAWEPGASRKSLGISGVEGQ